MSMEECKKYIILQVERFSESDLRFARQICTLIKRYRKEKGEY